MFKLLCLSAINLFVSPFLLVGAFAVEPCLGLELANVKWQTFYIALNGFVTVGLSVWSYFRGKGEVRRQTEKRRLKRWRFEDSAGNEF